MRLNKVLAHAGYGSRRAAEELILQGRVTVDGQIVRELGLRLDPEANKVAVDGERIHMERPVYVAVHKPKGYVSTNQDPSGRPRVIDLLPELNERVYTIGRLDEDSTGLILLTNDGELANRLAHPRYGVEKVYRVLVAGHPDPSILDRLVDGVWLSDGKARARRARFGGKQGDATFIELTLAEGKNREVRRMLAKLGHKVMSLTRVSVGPVRLKGLSVGQWRYLTPQEVSLLQRVAAGETVDRPSRRERAPAPKRRGEPSQPLGGLGSLLGPERSEDGPGRRSRSGGGSRPGDGPPPRRRSGSGAPVGAREESGGPRPTGPRRRGDRPEEESRGGPPRRRDGASNAPRSARPGLYEPGSYRRAGRDEVEPDEILVPPVDGPEGMDRPGGRPPRSTGRRPPRPVTDEPVQGSRRPPRPGRPTGPGGPTGRPTTGERPPRGRKIVGMEPVSESGGDEGSAVPSRFRRAVGPARSSNREQDAPPPPPQRRLRRPKPLPPRRRNRPGDADE